VTGCTFVGNVAGHASAGGGGGGAYLTHGRIRNSILWDNTVVGSSTGSALWLRPPLGVPVVVAVEYCDIEGGITSVAGLPTKFTYGPGNIDVDPMFLDSNGGDLRLAASSPCVNAGDPRWSPGLFQRDLDRNPRSVTGVDMGAYER
jgi:hypothetical protein